MLLENTASNVVIFFGEFLSDDLKSGFEAKATIKLSYSDFMAWVYTWCTVVTRADGSINFCISYAGFENAKKECLNNLEACFNFTYIKLYK
jgi:hypothetical protein